MVILTLYIILYATPGVITGIQRVLNPEVDFNCSDLVILSALPVNLVTTI